MNASQATATEAGRALDALVALSVQLSCHCEVEPDRIQRMVATEVVPQERPIPDNSGWLTHGQQPTHRSVQPVITC